MNATGGQIQAVSTTYALILAAACIAMAAAIPHDHAPDDLMAVGYQLPDLYNPSSIEKAASRRKIDNGDAQMNMYLMLGPEERQTFYYNKSNTLTYEVDLPLTNGTAVYDYVFTFKPEKGKTIDDYIFETVSSNGDVLTSDDVSVSSFLFMEPRSYNVSVDFDFTRSSGVTDFVLNVVDKTNGSIVASSRDIEFRVSGMVFFYTNYFGNRRQVGGDGNDRKLTLTIAEILGDNMISLEVFIQYPDGTNSSSSLESSAPLSGIEIALPGLDKELLYDFNVCAVDGGTFDGTNVALVPGCGLGFSGNTVNSVYVGPQFGLDFETNRNGSFQVGFDWFELVANTDLEESGYETYLNVAIIGEAAPIVSIVSPSRPFGDAGTDTVSVVVDNLPKDSETAAAWNYDGLEIDFAVEGGPEDSRPAKFVSSAVNPVTGLTTILYNVPVGSGSSLPWTLTITKPTGERLQAVDATGGYRFSFVNQTTLTSLTPDSGPIAGRTSITAGGSFVGFNINSDTSFITVGATTINKADITSVSGTSITFIMPAEADLSAIEIDGVYDVVVTAEGVSSGSLPFAFISTIFIESIDPSTGPVVGGTQAVLTGTFDGFSPNESGSTITIGGIVINVDDIVFFNSTTIVFETPPLASLNPSSSIYRNPIIVTTGGISSNSVEFVYQAPVVITNITPSFGPEAGGNTVTLNGQFVNFDPSNSGVYYGGKEIDESSLISVSDSEIVYNMPPRTALGLQHLYDVTVAIDDTSSNVVSYTFAVTEFSLEIDGSGSSFNPDTENYEVGACGNTLYRANFSNAALNQGATMQWTLTDGISGDSVLSGTGIVTNSETLYLPYTVFPARDREYVLTITVITSYASQTSSIKLVQLTSQNIGVKIFDPDKVSPGNPNVTLTIPADIGVPGCYNTNIDDDVTSPEITYIWVFRGETYTFSHLNKTVDESIVGPTLLGREFKIPQKFMEYGSFSLKLTAYFNSNPDVRGSDSTIVVIAPATLIAQINAGQSETSVSQTTAIVVSGGQSRDPDILTGDQTLGLGYSWTCIYGWDRMLTTNITCGNAMLPTDVSSGSFVIDKRTLANFRNSSKVYIRYQLAVSKISKNATNDDIRRISPLDTSVLVLSEDENVSYESLNRINIYDNQSTPIDASNVKYYQDVIIVPISTSELTTWSYKLTSPRFERTLLLLSDNLIPYAGYWAVGDDSGRNALGLRANALSPGTTYQFLISSSHAGLEENAEVLEIVTVEEPNVTISGIPVVSGYTNDTYVLSAFTSYEDDFKFFFTLTDEFGFSTCADGCQGTSLVRFRIGSAGSYQVACDVYDSLGFTLLATTTSATNITVESAISYGLSLSVFAVDLESAFLSGDHASYQQLGVDMVKYILSGGGSDFPDDDSDILANYTANMGQIVGNSVPNSIQSAGFVKTAVALARLTPALNIWYSPDTLYRLVNITFNSVTRTPDTAALLQLDELLAFYSLTPELVVGTGSSGSTRRRLFRTDQDDSIGAVNVLVLDFYEVMKDLIGVVALKPTSCGYINDMSTDVLSPNLQALNSRFLRTSARESIDAEELVEQAKTPAALYANPTQGLLSATSFQVARICNPEQGLQLSLALDEASGGELSCRFGWCKELFENSFKNLYFMLVRTPDYVYVSNIRRNTTLMDGLMTTVIAQILPNNTFVDATLPIENCYRVDISIPRSVVQPANTTLTAAEKENQVPQACQLQPRRQWGMSVDSSAEYYYGFFSKRSTTKLFDSSTDSSLSIASFRTSKTGVFTIATKIAWDGGFFSLDGHFLTLAEVIGTTFSVGLLIGLAILASWMIATRLVAAIGAPPPVEANFTYVERDVYGRGTAIDMMDASQDADTFADGDIQR
jgi:hypothetical protein